MFAGDAVTLPDARGCVLKVVVEFRNSTLKNKNLRIL
jgi:hypothetical protein